MQMGGGGIVKKRSCEAGSIISNLWVGGISSCLGRTTVSLTTLTINYDHAKSRFISFCTVTMYSGVGCLPTPLDPREQWRISVLSDDLHTPNFTRRGAMGWEFLPDKQCCLLCQF